MEHNVPDKGKRYKAKIMKEKEMEGDLICPQERVRSLEPQAGY